MSPERQVLHPLPARRTRQERVHVFLSHGSRVWHPPLTARTGISVRTRHIVDRFRRVTKRKQRNHLLAEVCSVRIGTQFDKKLRRSWSGGSGGERHGQRFPGAGPLRRGCAVHRRTPAPRHIGTPSGRGGPGHGPDGPPVRTGGHRRRRRRRGRGPRGLPRLVGSHSGRTFRGAAPLRRRTRRAGGGLRVRRIPAVRQAAQALHRVRRPRHRRQHLVLHAAPPATSKGDRPPSTAQTTPPTYAARPSGSSARSHPGTIPSRWRPGRSSPPSPRATPSC